MYRIRSASGNEVSYNSLEEFSAAVRRGEVHPEDEIFHTRANRWLDVKSHPHYRSATHFHGPEPTAAAAPRAPAQRPAPVQMPGQSAPAPSATSSRAQVFERPVIRSAPQTTVRPQLQPAPAAPVPASEPVTPPRPEASAAVAPNPEAPERYVRPKKSKELAFIDLGDPAPPAKPKAVAAEPEPRAPVAPPKPEAKAEPRPAAAPSAAAAPAPSAPAAVAPPAAAAGAPAAPVAATPRAAAPPTGPGSEVEFLVMDGGIESPVRTSAGQKAVPEDLDLLFNAPMPQAPDQNAPARGITVVGVPPKGAPTQRSGKVPAVHVEAPARAATAPTETITASAPAKATAHSKAAEPTAVAARRVEIEPADLDIPAGPLVEPPVHPVASAPAFQAMSPRPNALLLGGGIALLAVVGALLAWRPWKGGSTAAAPAEQRSQPTAPRLVGAPAPTPIRGPTTSGAAANNGRPIKPGATGKAAEGANSSSSADTGGEEEVIAAAKPTFRTDVAVNAVADLKVGADVGSRAAGPSASPSQLVERLVNAERQAQQELNRSLASAGFRNVLATGRLSSASGVGAARSAWSTGADAIRQYRGRLARLESAYEDSVLSAQRAQRWSGGEITAWATRQSLAEPAETSQLADLMFSQVNEGLDILAALDGEYTIKGDEITFKNATSATRYTSIRGWVAQRTSTWASIPESARPYSVTVILHALGDGLPAVR